MGEQLVPMLQQEDNFILYRGFFFYFIEAFYYTEAFYYMEAFYHIDAFYYIEDFFIGFPKGLIQISIKTNTCIKEIDVHF